MTGRERMMLVLEDVRSDAAKLDGQPLTGLTVGTMFGNVLAMIEALATTIDEILASQEPSPDPAEGEFVNRFGSW